MNRPRHIPMTLDRLDFLETQLRRSRNRRVRINTEIKLIDYGEELAQEVHSLRFRRKMK